MKKQPVKINISGSRWVTAAILALMPIAVLVITQLVTLQSGKALIWCLQNPLAALLGWLILLTGGAAMYALCARLWAAWIVCALPSVMLSLVSYYKTVINGTPLTLGDLSLAGQFGEIAGFALPQVRFTVYVISAVAAFAAVTVLLILLDRRLHREGRMRIACLICAVLCAVIIFTGAGGALAQRLTGEDQTQAERIDSAGVVGAFYCAAVSDRQNQRALANRAEELAPAVPAMAEVEEPDTVPNVIFLMSESFFDVTQLPGLYMENDPIPNFHALQQDNSCGKFISNTYCGGTGYVEMEVLTGICSNFLKETDTLTSLPEDVYSSMPCITDVFSLYGYRKEFIHSYNSALYNRAVIYDAFGFDSVRFSDSFPADAEISGGYISDMALAKEIIASYENGDKAEPMMMFAISMENHQPYTAEKYGGASPAGLESRVLSDDELAVVDACVYGLYKADEALGYLTDYFAGVEEPVMIVFWGDHLPNLSLPDGATAYEKLGKCSGSDTTAWSPEELESMLSTDYVIWTNYGLEKRDATLSSTYLGLNVLERLGFSLTDYYAWLSDGAAWVSKMYRPRLFVDAQGDAYGEIPEEYADVMEDCAAAVYDIVYGSCRLFRHYREE